MRNTGRYRQRARRRRVDERRRNRCSRGGRNQRKGAGRHILNGILWTTSMIMILTLLPAESNASKKLADLTADGNALAVAASKISDFGSDSLSGNSGQKDEQDAKTQESGNTQEEKAGKDAAKEKIGEIVLTDYTSQESSSDESASQGVSTAAKKASDIAETAVQQAEKNAADGENLKQGSGNIIIYHTHATESYLPAASSNAHTTELKSTVREAGETLTSRLKLHGFSVVHDMTLHDSPSYNKSYNRSLETVKKLCASYSNKKLVIDLHRDAATSSGKGKTATIDGKKVAAFCLVVGTQNKNYSKLRALAEKITTTANKMYPGFAKPIVEKPYKFNEYVSDSYILLEVGNNANTIDEVNAAMPYLAKVLTEVVA